MKLDRPVIQKYPTGVQPGKHLSGCTAFEHYWIPDLRPLILGGCPWPGGFWEVGVVSASGAYRYGPDRAQVCFSFFLSKLFPEPQDPLFHHKIQPTSSIHSEFDFPTLQLYFYCFPDFSAREQKIGLLIGWQPPICYNKPQQCWVGPIPFSTQFPTLMLLLHYAIFVGVASWTLKSEAKLRSVNAPSQ